MKQYDCDECGDTIVVANNSAERPVNGETAVEHMNRTGHSTKQEPRLTGCPTCGNAWFYTGSADRATCPNCRGKATPGNVPDEIDDAYAQATERSQ